MAPTQTRRAAHTAARAALDGHRAVLLLEGWVGPYRREDGTLVRRHWRADGGDGGGGDPAPNPAAPIRPAWLSRIPAAWQPERFDARQRAAISLARRRFTVKESRRLDRIPVLPVPLGTASERDLAALGLTTPRAVATARRAVAMRVDLPGSVVVRPTVPPEALVAIVEHEFAHGLLTRDALSPPVYDRMKRALLDEYLTLDGRHFGDGTPMGRWIEYLESAYPDEGARVDELAVEALRASRAAQTPGIPFAVGAGPGFDPDLLAKAAAIVETALQSAP